MNVWIVSHQYIVSHRMMKQRFKKNFFFCLICSCWNTSALMERLKKKKKRENRKRKEKLSPVISQEEKSWDYPQVSIHCWVSSPVHKVFLITFPKVISQFLQDLLSLLHWFFLLFCPQSWQEHLSITADKLDTYILRGNNGCLKDEFLLSLPVSTV